MSVKSAVDYSGNSVGKNRARFWAYGQVPIDTLLKKKHVVIASRECGDIAFLISLGVNPINIIACDIDATALDEAAKFGVSVSPYHDIESTISHFVDPSELGTVNVDLCQTLASVGILTSVLKRVECTVFYTFFRARDSFHSTEERLQHLQMSISLAGCKTTEKGHLDYQSRNGENNGSPMCCVAFYSREEWYALAGESKRLQLEQEVGSLAKIIEDQKKANANADAVFAKWRQEIADQVSWLVQITAKPANPIVSVEQIAKRCAACKQAVYVLSTDLAEVVYCNEKCRVQHFYPKSGLNKYTAPERAAGENVSLKYKQKEQAVIEFCQGKDEINITEVLSSVFNAKTGDYGMARNVVDTISYLGFERVVTSTGGIVYRAKHKNCRTCRNLSMAGYTCRKLGCTKDSMIAYDGSRR